MIQQKNLVVLGAGGHARSVCDILEQSGAYHIIGLVAADPADGFWGWRMRDRRFINRFMVHHWSGRRRRSGYSRKMHSGRGAC